MNTFSTWTLGGRNMELPENLIVNTPSLIEQIRAVVREELARVFPTSLPPEEREPAGTVEYEANGKRYRGVVYLVEDADVNND